MILASFYYRGQNLDEMMGNKSVDAVWLGIILTVVFVFLKSKYIKISLLEKIIILKKMVIHNLKTKAIEGKKFTSKKLFHSSDASSMEILGLYQAVCVVSW